MTTHKNVFTGETQHGIGSGVEGDTRMPSLRNVKEDVSQLKYDVADYATTAAQVAAHTGVDAVKTGAAQVAETGKKAADLARGSHHKVCEYISAHPTTSVLVAVGIGAIMARFLPRR